MLQMRHAKPVSYSALVMLSLTSLSQDYPGNTVRGRVCLGLRLDWDVDRSKETSDIYIKPRLIVIALTVGQCLNQCYLNTRSVLPSAVHLPNTDTGCAASWLLSGPGKGATPGWAGGGSAFAPPASPPPGTAGTWSPTRR